MKTNTQSITRKILFLFSFCYFLNANAQALPPEKFSFQAVVRNAGNQLVANQTIGLRISVLSVVMGSETPEFVETHTATTNQNGLFSVQIGNGTTVSGALITAMNSNAQSKKIKCEIDPTGGTNYTIISNEPLLSVPYALKSNSAVYANNADFATTAATANSVTGIAGNSGFISAFGANNTLGNSAIYNDAESGNIGIQNQNPVVALDVAGNGTILARNRIVLGPVGGNPQTSPVWAADNFNNDFRIFKQSNISTPGTTYFSISTSGNTTVTNLTSSGNIFANGSITGGNNSTLGNGTTLGTNATIQAGATISPTNAITMGSGGRTISNLLFGTATIGSSPGYIAIYDVVFSTPMPNNNYAVSLTIVEEDFTFDQFRVFCKSKTPNGFKILVKRDDGDSWGQNLKVDWMVICGQ